MQSCRRRTRALSHGNHAETCMGTFYQPLLLLGLCGISQSIPLFLLSFPLVFDLVSEAKALGKVSSCPTHVTGWMCCVAMSS